MKIFAVTVSDRYIPVVKHVITICADNAADCNAKIKAIMNNRVFVIKSIEEVNESSNRFIERTNIIPNAYQSILTSKIKEEKRGE